MNLLGFLRFLAAVLKYGAMVCGAAVSVHALKERTWDEQNRKLTNAGLRQKRLLAIAMAVALLGAISQDIADQIQKISDERSHEAQLEDALEKGDAKVRKSLKDFNQKDVAPQFTDMLDRQEQATKALEADVEAATRELRISQTPVDEIVLSLSLTKSSFSTNKLLAQYGIDGSFQFDQPVPSLPNSNHDNASMLTSRELGNIGKPAYDFGQQVYEDVFCAPVLTPGAIREEFGDTPPTLRALTIREDVIGSIVLHRRIVSINFKPIGVLAGYFQDAPVRIRFRPNCQLPSERLRLQVTADGFAADTRFFDPHWKAQFAMGSVGSSPIIRLRASGGRDEPVPKASSPKR